MPDAPPVLTNDARYRINPCPVPTMRRWIESTLPPVPTMPDAPLRRSFIGLAYMMRYMMPGCMMRRIVSKFAF